MKLVLTPGMGIGPEVTARALRELEPVGGGSAGSGAESDGAIQLAHLPTSHKRAPDGVGG